MTAPHLPLADGWAGRLRAWIIDDEPTRLAHRRAAAADSAWLERTLRDLGARCDEAVLVSTCERCEAYMIGERDHAAAWLLGAGRSLDGVLAARRLLRVAAGLESRIQGESHIQGQIAAAARSAECARTMGPCLRAVFAHAARAGRRVRSETMLGRIAGSYVQATVELLAARPLAAVGVIGAGAIARELLAEVQRLSRGRGERSPRLVAFSRHVERARDSIGPDVEVLPLAYLPDATASLSALVAATLSSTALVTPDMLAHRRGPLLIVDLGTPANVDAGVAQLPQVELRTLGDLAGPTVAQATVDEAEAIVGSELGRLVARADLERGAVA